MIECRPYGICSWDYQLLAPRQRAEIRFAWATEQGSLLIDGQPHQVSKDGWLSGRWRLTGPDGRELMAAHKPSPFHRSFEIRGPDFHAFLAATSAFSRMMDLRTDSGRALIAPVHLFTRRAAITGADAIDFRLVAFAFWLSVLTWRRRSRNNSSN